MAKPMNHRRRIKALENTPVGKPRNEGVIAMVLRNGQGRHPDKKKAASKKACRGKVSW